MSMQTNSNKTTNNKAKNRPIITCTYYNKKGHLESKYYSKNKANVIYR
jgi:hypothetical protein